MLELNTNNAVNKAPYQLLVIPLLFEGNRYQDIVNRTLVIDCDESLQIARAMQRNNGLSEQAVRAIMNAQVPREKRIELADDVIENTVVRRVHEHSNIPKRIILAYYHRFNSP